MSEMSVACSNCIHTLTVISETTSAVLDQVFKKLILPHPEILFVTKELSY